jgi:signal transduction histidine kinase
LSERTSWTIFVSGIVILILLGFGTAAVTYRFASSEQQVAHTHEVETVIARLRANLFTANSDRLAFVLTGDEARLQQYRAEVIGLGDRLGTLKSLTADNPSQQGRITDLSLLVDEDLALMEQSVALKRSDPAGETKQREMEQKCHDILTLAVTVLSGMREEESRLMQQRVGTSRAAYQNILRVLLLAGAIVLMFLGLIFRMLLRQLQDRKKAEAAVRQLSIRILQLRDTEQRKLARELHDSLGQALAAISMNLSVLKEKGDDIAPDKRAALLADSVELAQQSASETRTISHLLHPPLLDEAGFSSAARWYVDGFTLRSKIPVELDISPDIGRLPHKTELVLFRTLQEGLTNIHKHSGSSRVIVRLAMRGSTIEFSVQDNGRGIPAAVLSEFQTTGGGSGIGLMGMRERIYDLHGQFNLESNASGTRINVILPSTQSDASPTEPEHNRHIGSSHSSSTDRATSKPIMKAVAAPSPG